MRDLADARLEEPASSLHVGGRIPGRPFSSLMTQSASSEVTVEDQGSLQAAAPTNSMRDEQMPQWTCFGTWIIRLLTCKVH